MPGFFLNYGCNFIFMGGSTCSIGPVPLFLQCWFMDANTRGAPGGSFPQEKDTGLHTVLGCSQSCLPESRWDSCGHCWAKLGHDQKKKKISHQGLDKEKLAPSPARNLDSGWVWKGKLRGQLCTGFQKKIVSKTCDSQKKPHPHSTEIYVWVYIYIRQLDFLGKIPKSENQPPKKPAWALKCCIYPARWCRRAKQGGHTSAECSQVEADGHSSVAVRVRKTENWRNKLQVMHNVRSQCDSTERKPPRGFCLKCLDCFL